MNIYDLMTDDLGKVKEFEAACEDMLNSRYILADSKIIKILQTVALSTVLQSIIGGALKGFDYAATARKWGDNDAKPPETEKDHVALVFCILADLDNHRIYLNDFLRSFFWNGDINSAYSAFCNAFVAPFEHYVVGALSQAHEAGPKVIEEPAGVREERPEIALPRMEKSDKPIVTLTGNEFHYAGQNTPTEDQSFRLPPEEGQSFTAQHEEQSFRLPPEEGQPFTAPTEEQSFRLPPEEARPFAASYEEQSFRLPPEEAQPFTAPTEEQSFRLPPEEGQSFAASYEEQSFRLPPDETDSPNIYQENNTYQTQANFAPQPDLSSFDRKINNLADAIERYLYESRDVKDNYIFACDGIASAARTDRASALVYAKYLRNLLSHIPEITPYIADVIDELS